MGPSLPHQHTVYVSNIFEKLKLEGATERKWRIQRVDAVLLSRFIPFRHIRIAELKKCMRTIFEQFGPVLDVVARKTYRLRGQAWVVFERAEDAEKAVKPGKVSRSTASSWWVALWGQRPGQGG